MAHRLHYSYPMKTTNDKMNAVAAAVASDLGIDHEEAAALLVLVLRTQRAELLAAVRAARAEDIASTYTDSRVVEEFGL